MPYEFSETQIRGHQVLKVVGTGKLLAPDAQQVMERTGLTGTNPNWPALYVMMPNSEVTAEARKVFADRSRGTPATPDSLTAIVVFSAVMRVTAQFLTRLSPGPGQIKFFKSEDEATSWLDSELSKRAR